MSLAMQCSALHSSVGALSLYQGPPYNLLQVVLPIRHHFPPSKKHEEGREEVMTELRAWASLQSCGGCTRVQWLMPGAGRNLALGRGSNEGRCTN